MIGNLVTDENRIEIARKLILENHKKQKGVNLQNIPSRTKEGEQIRKCFVPSKDHIFVGADLSQAEPRVEAHIMWTKYKDNSLRKIFVDNQDLYTTMAMLAFSLPREYCIDGAWYDPVSKIGGPAETKDQAPTTAYEPRKMMKQGILALGYLQTEKRFAEKMRVSDDVAKMVFEKFNTSFPSFSTMVSDSIDFMKKNGYVETIFGRKRRFHEYKKLEKQLNQNKLIKLYVERKKLKDSTKSSDLKKLEKIQNEIDMMKKIEGRLKAMEREAFNAIIQGSATSDIIKLNGIRMVKICKERGWRLPALIHDEIIVEIPKRDLTQETIDLIQDVMCNTASKYLTVPLKSDVVIMPRWMEEYSPEQWDFLNCCPKI